MGQSEGDPAADVEHPHEVTAEHVRPARSRWWYLLLLPSYIGLLWVPFYASDTPELFGFPFFYWYQFAWIPITSILTWIVYKRVS